jgi:hypothetical protein
MRGCRIFLVILDLRWELVQILDFGMTYGVGIIPLRKLSEFIWYCEREGCFHSGSFEAFKWFPLVEHKLY